MLSERANVADRRHAEFVDMDLCGQVARRLILGPERNDDAPSARVLSKGIGPSVAPHLGGLIDQPRTSCAVAADPHQLVRHFTGHQSSQFGGHGTSQVVGNRCHALGL